MASREKLYEEVWAEPMTTVTVARELRGLTRADLAERISKTASAISQFETGRSRPDGKTVASLALVRGFPAGFFARPECHPLSLDACHFRRLRSASQRERRRLLSIGTLLTEVVGALEEHVEFPDDQVSVAARAVSSAEGIERCAVDVRRAWGLGLGPIPNIVKLLQSKGVIVCVVPNTCHEVDAFSAWLAQVSFAVAARKQQTPKGRRNRSGGPGRSLSRGSHAFPSLGATASRRRRQVLPGSWGTLACMPRSTTGSSSQAIRDSPYSSAR